jgi:hypothetical protein
MRLTLSVMGDAALPILERWMGQEWTGWDPGGEVEEEEEEAVRIFSMRA